MVAEKGREEMGTHGRSWWAHRSLRDGPEWDGVASKRTAHCLSGSCTISVEVTAVGG